MSNSRQNDYATELTFTAHYKYRERFWCCCIPIDNINEKNKPVGFCTLAQLTALFDQAMDEHEEHANTRKYKNLLFNVRIHGKIEGVWIPAYELRERDDCRKFFELYPNLDRSLDGIQGKIQIQRLN